jgi:hypothetical protein
MTLLFCYGSNSIKQIKERINENINKIEFQKAYLNNHVRIFAGKSIKWDCGGVASVYPLDGKKVYGIAVTLNDDQLEKLNKFEKGYSLVQKDIIIKNKVVNAFLFIKDNIEFSKLPSNSYMNAINNMLNDRGFDDNRTILVRAVINNKVKLIYKWNKNK